MANAASNAAQGNAPGPAPRRLSTHQQAVLIQVLLTFAGEPLGLSYVPSTADAEAYAGDFLTIFKSIDWTVDRAEPALNFPASSGLAVVTRDEKLPPSAEALRDSLRIYGIEAKVIPNRGNFDPTKRFVLVVT